MTKGTVSSPTCGPAGHLPNELTGRWGHPGAGESGPCQPQPRSWAQWIDLLDRSAPEVLVGWSSSGELEGEAGASTLSTGGCCIQGLSEGGGAVGAAERKGDAAPASCPLSPECPQQTVGCPVARWVSASPALPEAAPAASPDKGDPGGKSRPAAESAPARSTRA